MRLWYSSKISFIPDIIVSAVFLSGSGAFIFWNLLSRAESFSIYFWYSLRVVAPITLIFHLHIAGLSILLASSVPSELPAPIIVWISSINKITSFSAFEASSITCLIRVSNSQRNFVPATRELISRLKIRLSLIEKGTFPEFIASASHSTIAVFPTHGSQTSTGLFFVFLLRIEISLSISSCLPMILSIFHSSASFERSVEKKSRAGVELSIFAFFSGFLFISNGVSKSFCPKRESEIAPSIFEMDSSPSFTFEISSFVPSIVLNLFSSTRFVSTSLGSIPINSRAL